MTSFTINRACISAIAPFMSTEETRYYLNGICFRDGCLAATDGHRLGVVKPVSGDDIPDGCSFTLPKDTVKKILSAKPEYRKLPVFVMFDDNNATVFQDKNEPIASFSYKPVDGEFPDYKRVLPKQEDLLSGTEPTCFNADYLGSFKSFGNDVLVYLNKTPEAPSIFRCLTDEYDAVGCLMPMRAGFSIKSVYPEWLCADFLKKEETTMG